MAALDTQLVWRGEILLTLSWRISYPSESSYRKANLFWIRFQGVPRSTQPRQRFINDIFANALNGVEIKGEGSDPTLRNNRIHKNAFSALYVHDEGGGTVEENDLSGNVKGAWEVSPDSKPNLNRIRNTE